MSFHGRTLFLMPYYSLSAVSHRKVFSTLSMGLSKKALAEKKAAEKKSVAEKKSAEEKKSVAENKRAAASKRAAVAAGKKAKATKAEAAKKSAMVASKEAKAAEAEAAKEETEKVQGGSGNHVGLSDGRSGCGRGGHS